MILEYKGSIRAGYCSYVYQVSSEVNKMFIPSKGLVKFANRGVPRSYAQEVVVRATVVPLYGPVADRADAAAKGNRLVAAWRTRIGVLARAGWDAARVHDRATPGAGVRVVDSHTWLMLNCRPAAFVPDPETP